jgi:hypothetical protein
MVTMRFAVHFVGSPAAFDVVSMIHDCDTTNCTSGQVFGQAAGCFTYTEGSVVMD